MTNASRYSALSDDQLRLLHEACESFEQALASDRPVSIETQLQSASPETRRPLFCELLAIELEWRQSRGERPDPTVFETRFPDNAVEIRRAFHELTDECEATAEDGALF